MLITNGNLITWEEPNQILEDSGMYIREGSIVDVAPSRVLVEKYPFESVIDAKNQYILPGNICAHTHFYGAFSRGMGIGGGAPKDFPEILKKLWWPLDKSLTLDDVRLSALVCLVDAIRHGTTTLVDHHASPNAIDGSLDTIAEAVLQAGVRASLCYEVTDRDGAESTKAGIQENLRFLRRLKENPSPSGRLSGTFGLHASLTLSEETLNQCRQMIPEGTGIQIHVAEHPVDQYDSLDKYGMRVVDRLNQHQLLGPDAILVHAVHVDANEMWLIKEKDCWVTHQPRSNMNNAVGLPDVQSMLRAGIKVCLGNDGFSNAMWSEWKETYLAHKLIHKDPRWLPATEIVQMAIRNNSALASKLFNTGVIGTLEPGAKADLIFVDYHPITPLSADNLPWHILYGFNESMVTTTIVDGDVLMLDRQLISLDEEKIAYEARHASSAVWERYKQQF